jgi:hypothetical protein
MGLIGDSIVKSYKQGRLIFKEGDKAEYRAPNETKVMSLLSIDDLASLLWLRFSDELLDKTKASLAYFAITVDDVKGIILKMKEQGGKA